MLKKLFDAEPVLVRGAVLIVFMLAAWLGLPISGHAADALNLVALGVYLFITRTKVTPNASVILKADPPSKPSAAASPASMEHEMTTILDQLASGQLAAPALIKQIATDLKAAEPFLGPAEAWGIDAAERWLATKIPPTIAAMLANEIKVELDLVPEPAAA